MLIKLKDVCNLLSLSRDGLKKLQQRDSDFPKAIKLGDSRQSSVFFIKEELDQWLDTKKAERNQVAR